MMETEWMRFSSEMRSSMHRIMAEWSLDKLAVLARQAMGAVLNRL